jgi:TP901 family phage tail tape measure protein
VNDAELSVGIDASDFGPTLQKMAGQVRQFGSTIGAEASSIDKAVRKVTGAVADLSKTGGAIKSSPLAANIAATRKEMERLEALSKRASGISVSNSSFSGFRENGKGIKASEAKEILNAADSYAKLEAQLKSLTNTEERMARASRAAGFAAQQEAMFPKDIAQQVANMRAVSREADVLRGVYSQMWGEVSAINGKKNSWWPPEMFKGAQQFTQRIMDMQNSVRYAMYDVSRNTAIAGAAVMALGVGAVVAAARWERAFADVQRTVQGTPRTLEQIRQGLVSLSQDIPVGFTQLAEIASVGGQLGISANGIVAYTETIAKLTATTNLTADAASKALGRFKAFFAEADDSSLAVTDQTFSNLASSILRVGVNSVATESGIVNVATQISSMGSYAGFTADQVIGLAGALSSVGVPPELSRGVITRLFNTIGEAVSQNGTKLQDFARLAGVSSEEFRAAWGTDQFAFIFTKMVAGLNTVTQNGGDAVRALHDLGITSVRDVPVLLRLASAAGEAGTAGSLLAQTMNDARQGWRQNIELTLQYNKISDTLTERTKVLLQNFEALFATMGQSSVGPIKDMVNGLIGLIKGFTTLAASPVGQFLGTATIAVSVLAGALLLLTSAGARTFASMQGLAAGLQFMGVSAEMAAPAVRVLGFAIAGLGAVAAIGAIVGLFVAMAQGAEQANNAIQDTQGALAAMKQDAADKAGYVLAEGMDTAKRGAKDLSTQADSLGKVLGFAQDQMYGVGEAATAATGQVKTAALQYGKASADFARSAVIQQKAFTDLFQGSSGSGFADRLVKNGFDLDKALEVASTKDRAAVRKYLEEVGGEFDNMNRIRNEGGPSISFEDADRYLKLLDILDQTGAGMRAVASQAYATGDAFTHFTNATQITEDAMNDFKVQNEDTIKSIADGFGKFVDSGTLINMTQQMRDAYATVDDGSTDVNEHAEAVANFEKAWTDAYGGAKFSIEDYMVTFRRAAQEQQTFMTNLQTLLARGVEPAIIGDLAAMGPQAQALVQALVDSTDEQLQEYVALYQQTGFDAMVGMAAGQLAAQQIVMNAAKNLSTAQLRELSADLSAGTPLTDAMKKWNLDAQGKPMKAPATVYSTDNWLARFQTDANRNPLYLPVRAFISSFDTSGLNAQGVRVSLAGGFAGGGYTGAGGMYDYAGPAHRGEYIFTKAETDQSTGKPKTSALLRMLSGRTSARSGNTGAGYAGGGYAGNSTGQVIAHLSVEDRALLALIADRVGITITQDTMTNLVNSGNVNSSNRRQG